MVDTFLLKIRLDSFQRDQVFKVVNQVIKNSGSTRFLYLDKNSKSDRFKRYRTSAFYPFGILEIAIIDCFYSCNNAYFIAFKCKPAVVLHGDDEPYALSNHKDYEAVASMLDSLIEILNRYMDGKPLEPVSCWRVYRIDYAFQIITDHPDLYMMLLRKGLPYKDDKYDDSVYIKKSKCTVNFYDKTSEQGLDARCHVLRFEVQTNSDYLYKMQNEGRISDLSLRALWNRELALSIVVKQIEKLIGTGDFYSLEAAIPIINQAFKVTDEERSYLELILKISLYPSVRRKSMWDLFEIYAAHSGGTCRLTKRLEHILKRLKINPIAIPARRRVDCLDNPANIIRKSFTNT